MTKKSDIIELNGKHYDARTGQLLASPIQQPKLESTQAKKITVTEHKPKASKISHQAAHHSVPADTKHRRTERPKTLMRHAVKKPAAPKQKTTEHPLKRHATPRLKPDPSRLERAQKTAKHQAVSRFGVSSKITAASTEYPAVKPVITELPVQPEPQFHTPVQATAPQPSHENTFQHMLDQANSHTQPRHKRPTRRQHVSYKLGVSTRVINFSAAVLSAVLLIGFFAYQNLPNLSMRLAAQRSGVAAQMPGYQPAGFGLSGPIEYGRGQITLDFRSHSDERQFRISQHATAWDNHALLEEYLDPTQETYQTLQYQGKTVHIYNQGATWVHNGVWYEVDNKARLSNDQLLRLAASL